MFSLSPFFLDLKHAHIGEGYRDSKKETTLKKNILI
jgi:hypothetical protein